MITQEWCNQIGSAIQESCPMTAADKDALADVRSKILAFQQEHGRLPDELTIVTQFCVPHENRLLQAARTKKRKDFLHDVGLTREAVMDDLRKLREPEPARKTFTPERELSQAEIDSLSDDDAKRVLFGVESSDLNRNSSALNAQNPQNERDQYYRDQLLSYRGKDPIRIAMRRQLLDDSERRDTEHRAKIVEADKQERKRIQEELRKNARRGL